MGEQPIESAIPGHDERSRAKDDRMNGQSQTHYQRQARVRISVEPEMHNKPAVSAQ